MNKIKIATRQSNLALWQTNWVASMLTNLYPNLQVELVKITTKGDKILDKSLSKIGGKGLFVKELEQALLTGEADIAVHSLKDMPAQQPQGLELAVFCPRADARDVLISRQYYDLASIPLGACIGTSSVRRMAQLKIYRPDLKIKLLRGNVDTRIAKALDETEGYDAIILAAAGVERLLQGELINQYLPIGNFLPAPGQGIVTIECRSHDQPVKELLSKLACMKATASANAERAFNFVMGGSCQTPIAAYSELINESEMVLYGQIASPDGKQQIKSSLKGLIKHASDLGELLATEILNSGGRTIIDNLTDE